MTIKPKLVDINLISKVKKNSNLKVESSYISKLGTSLSSSFVSFIKNYSDLLLVLMILGIILYFRYKYNLKLKSKNKSPDQIEVNYHRKDDYVDGELVNTNNNIDYSNENVNDDILEIVNSKINNFDDNYELESFNFNNL